MQCHYNFIPADSFEKNTLMVSWAL